MWRMFLIIGQIFVLLSGATNSQPIIKHQKYNHYISNFILPVFVPITNKNMNGKVTVQTCAVDCHLHEDCAWFCFTPGSCAVAKIGGYLNIRSTETANEGNHSKYDCYLKDKINNEESEGIIKVLNVENVALNKPTKESSLYREEADSPTYSAALVVDGNLMREFFALNKTCMDTYLDDKPWLLIDLQATYLVMFINITNNDHEKFRKRFHDTEVRVGLNARTDTDSADSFTHNPLCAEYLGIGDDFWLIPCVPNPITGNIVTVQIVRECTGDTCNDEITKVLGLCEVQVYALA